MRLSTRLLMVLQVALIVAAVFSFAIILIATAPETHANPENYCFEGCLGEFDACTEAGVPPSECLPGMAECFSVCSWLY